MKKYFTEIVICLLIVAAGLVIYAQIGRFDYILYDDMLSLYDPFLTEGTSLKKISRVFYDLPDRLPYQIQIPAIARLILWEMFGGNPGQHHLFSLCLHIACALMLFVFLRLSTGNKPASGFCALLFTVHPINVEAVSWLAAYNGMLEAFFLMAALIGYYYYARSPSVKRYLLILIPFIMGLMSKPSIAVLPFLLLLLDYWPLQRIDLNWTGIKKIRIDFESNKIIAEKVPLVLVVAIHFLAKKLITTGQLGNVNPGSWAFHPGSILDFTFHLKKFFYPTGLAICRPDPPEAPIWTLTGILGIILLISFFIVRKGPTFKYLITGWFWFLLAATPVLLMLLLSGRAVEDHHLYIPLIGIMMMISFGLSSLLSGLKHGRLMFPAAGIIIVALLIPMAYLQTRHWESSLTIFNHALSINPDNKKAHVILGDAYMQRAVTGKAIHHYRQFLRISPGSALGHTKLAHALATADMTDEATRHYNKALDLSLDYVPALHGMADLLVRTGKADKAIALYRRALKINPDLFQTLNNLALALYERGQRREACDLLKQAITINPDYKTAARNLGIILDSRGRGNDKEAQVERPGQNMGTRNANTGD